MKKTINPFNVTYPDQIKTWKGQLGYQYQKQMYYLDIGRGQVIGKFTQLFPDVGWFMAGLIWVNTEYDLGLNITGRLILTIMSVTLFGTWYVGFLYALINMDKVKNIVHKERDPYISEIHDEIVKRKK